MGGGGGGGCLVGLNNKLFERVDHFTYFLSKGGNYLREAID